MTVYYLILIILKCVTRSSLKSYTNKNRINTQTNKLLSKWICIHQAWYQFDFISYFIQKKFQYKLYVLGRCFGRSLVFNFFQNLGISTWNLTVNTLPSFVIDQAFHQKRACYTLSDKWRIICYSFDDDMLSPGPVRSWMQQMRRIGAR